MPHVEKLLFVDTDNTNLKRGRSIAGIHEIEYIIRTLLTGETYETVCRHPR